MSDSEKNEKTYIQNNPKIYEVLKSQTDERVKMIYERYHTGKTIIMDDLKYILVKNPEAFEKITRSMIQSKSGKEFSFESINIGNRDSGKKNIDNATEEGKYINDVLDEAMPVENTVNVSDIMASVRSVIETMSEQERVELSENVYDPLELIKRIQVLNQLENAHWDKKVMYTSEKEKDIDISV